MQYKRASLHHANKHYLQNSSKFLGKNFYYKWENLPTKFPKLKVPSLSSTSSLLPSHHSPFYARQHCPTVYKSEASPLSWFGLDLVYVSLKQKFCRFMWLYVANMGASLRWSLQVLFSWILFARCTSCILSTQHSLKTITIFGSFPVKFNLSCFIKFLCTSPYILHLLMPACYGLNCGLLRSHVEAQTPSDCPGR